MFGTRPDACVWDAFGTHSGRVTPPFGTRAGHFCFNVCGLCCRRGRKLGHTVWPSEPWSKGKPELEHDVTVAMKEWVSRWVRGIGTDLGSFRDVIATAHVE